MTDAPFTPMLATPHPIPNPDDYPAILAAYIENDEFDLTQKADGWRMVVVVKDGTVVGINRTGGFTGVKHHLADVFKRLAGRYIFDCELVNDVLYVFDLPVAESGAKLRISPETPYLTRRQILEAIFDPDGLGAVWKPEPHVHLLPSARTADDKAALVHQVLMTAEGFVAKRLDSPYVPGTRSQHWRKLKRTKDVDCVVIATGRDGKKNLTLGLYVQDQDEPIEVGRVSSLSGTAAEVRIVPGEPPPVVTVRYLSWTGSRLREPTLPRLRTGEIDHTQCRIEQVTTGRTKEIYTT